MPTNPLSPYALQKLMGEMYGQMFTRLYGFETVTTRYFNVFGPRQDPGLAVLRRDLALHQGAARQARAPIIYGDGEQTRDFTYVTNVVDGVMRAAETPGVGGEVFNVATNSRISLNQLLATLKKIFGSNVEPIYKDARAGDVRDSQADISKAERLLGYKPIVGLEEGLRETVKWFYLAAVNLAVFVIRRQLVAVDLERRRAALVDARQHAGIDQHRAAAEAHGDRAALLRRVAGDESLRAVFLQQRRKRPAGRIVRHGRQPAIPQRAFGIDRQPGVDLHDLLRFHQQRHVELAAIRLLAFGLRRGDARVGEADLARGDLQDLLQREVARRELEVDQLVDELIHPLDLVAHLRR